MNFRRTKNRSFGRTTFLFVAPENLTPNGFRITQEMEHPKYRPFHLYFTRVKDSKVPAFQTEMEAISKKCMIMGYRQYEEICNAIFAELDAVVS